MNGLEVVKGFDRYCRSNGYSLFCVNLPSELSRFKASLSPEQLKLLIRSIDLRASDNSAWYSFARDFYASLTESQQQMAIQLSLDGHLKESGNDVDPDPEIEDVGVDVDPEIEIEVDPDIDGVDFENFVRFLAEILS